MCLEIFMKSVIKNPKKEFHKLLKVANRDIKVYKFLTPIKKSYKSPYRGFKYHLGYEYYQDENNLDSRFEYRISYSYRNEWEQDILVVAKGLHANSNKETKLNLFYPPPVLALCEFIIPKGAHYIRGYNNGDGKSRGIVCDRFIFNKVINEIKFK